MSIFIEGKFYRAMSTLWEVMYMGFLWTLFSLPIVTIGASTTALYYVATKKVTNREGSYIFQDFWRSFKENFKQSTITFLILVVVGLLVWYNFMLLDQMDMVVLSFIARLALVLVTIQLLFVVSTVFAVIARFDLILGAALKASLALANKHLFSTVTNIVVLLAVLYVAFSAPVILLFMMGAYGYFSSFVLVRMFKKNNVEFEEYIEETDPEIDII